MHNGGWAWKTKTAGDHSGSGRPMGRFRRCGIVSGIIDDRRFQNELAPARVLEAFEQNKSVEPLSEAEE